jgi:hypothetical protein
MSMRAWRRRCPRKARRRHLRTEGATSLQHCFCYLTCLIGCR